MSNFCERLLELREKTGLNQTQFAVLGGVKKETQLNYEKGLRKPDSDYLCALSEKGIDVTYLITGLINTNALTPEESLILNGYRALDARGRAAVLGVISGLNPAPAAVAPKFAVQGDIGNVIEGNVTAPQTFNFSVKQTKK